MRLSRHKLFVAALVTGGFLACAVEQPDPPKPSTTKAEKKKKKADGSDEDEDATDDETSTETATETETATTDAGDGEDDELPPPQTSTQSATATATTTATATEVAVNPGAPRSFTSNLIVTGLGAGGPAEAKSFDAPTRNLVATMQPYTAAWQSSVRVAAGDFDGDKVVEFATAAGPGGGPHVRILRRDGTQISDFFAYGTYAGGVFVTACDVDGDAKDEIVTGADAGGGPHVKVWHPLTGQEMFSFFPYPDGTTQGVRVGCGDVDGDGKAEVITSLGPGGAPSAKVLKADGTFIKDIPIFDAGFLGGVYVAAGDVDGDGKADVIAGADAGGFPVVRVFRVADNVRLAEFLAYDQAFTGGVRVAAGDADGDAKAEVITGAGTPGGAHVKVFSVTQGGNGEEKASFFPTGAPFNGGVYVGGLPRK